MWQGGTIAGLNTNARALRIADKTPEFLQILSYYHCYLSSYTKYKQLLVLHVVVLWFVSKATCGAIASLNTNERTLWIADEMLKFIHPLSQCAYHVSSHTKHPRSSFFYFVLKVTCDAIVGLNTTARILWMADETLKFVHLLSQCTCHVPSHTNHPRSSFFLFSVESNMWRYRRFEHDCMDTVYSGWNA